MNDHVLRLPRVSFEEAEQQHADRNIFSRGKPCFVCHSAENTVINSGSVRLVPTHCSVKTKMNLLARERRPGNPVDDTIELGLHSCQSCTNLVAAIDFLQRQLDEKLTHFYQLRNAKPETPTVEVECRLMDDAETGATGPQSDTSDLGGHDSSANSVDGTEEESSPSEPVDQFDDADYLGEEASSPKRRKSTRLTKRTVKKEQSKAVAPQQRARKTPSSASASKQGIMSKIAEIVGKRRETIGLMQWLKPSHCRLCDDTFEDDEVEAAIDKRLQHHRRVHSREALFVCHFCLAGFNSLTAFTCHVMNEELTRSEEIEFKCRFCLEDQVNPRKLDKHYREKHPTEEDNFVCVDCDESFRAYDDYIVHRQGKTGRPLFGDSKPPGLNGYSCPRCKEDCKAMNRLEWHYASIEFDITRNCDECGLRFPKGEMKGMHMHREHSELLARICETCGKSFESESLLSDHTTSCSSCPKPKPAAVKTSSIADFIERRKETIGFMQWCKPDQCRLCDAVFKDEEDGDDAIVQRLKHHQEMHEGEAPFLCHFCMAGFESVYAFSCHVMVEELSRSVEKEFRCQLCMEDMVNPRRLDIHYKQEHPAEQTGFVCDDCGETLETYDAFIAHRQSKTDRAMFGDDQPPGKEGFVCPRCGDCQKVLRRLENHLAGVEFGAVRNCDECGLHFRVGHQKEQHYNRDHLQQRPCTCTICGKGFESKTHLSMHMDYHLKPKPPQVCPICGVEIKGFIKYHIADKHQKAHRHKCDFCDERFIYRPGLKKHMALVHGHRVDRYQHPCDICGKIFTKAPSLRDHKFVAHGIKDPAIKIHKCEDCGKEFSKPEKLRRHLKTHSGIRPHACPHCEHRTVDFVNLKTHIRLKHKRLVKRVFRGESAGETDYDIVDADPQEEQEKKDKPRFAAELMKHVRAENVLLLSSVDAGSSVR